MSSVDESTVILPEIIDNNAESKPIRRKPKIIVLKKSINKPVPLDDEFFEPIVVPTDIQQDWTLEKIVKERPATGWKALFNSLGPTMRHIESQIYNDDYVPLKADIFNAYYYTPLQNVKVVIVGQDPYHTVIDDIPQAMGLAFSTRKTSPMQPSVRNIFKELQNSVPGFELPPHGDLTGWAKQGVLLLNTSLTTINGLAGAHDQLWFGLIQKTFKEITINRPNTIVVLWGKWAEKIRPFLGNLVTLSAAHPSPMSANRGFFGCNHFNLINEHLIKFNMKPIDWSKLD